MSQKSRSQRQRDLAACFGGRLSARGRRGKAEEWQRLAADLLCLAAPDAFDVDALASAIEMRPPDAETLVFLVRMAEREGLKHRQRRAAEAKNQKARRWAVQQWEKRPELNEGKAAFSRRIAPELQRRFGTKVSAEWIARQWLPKSEPPDMTRQLMTDPAAPKPIAWTGRPHYRR